MRRLHHSDRGLSLAELMVSMMLMAIVAAVFLSLLQTTMSATRDLEGTARSNDDVRLALQQMDRDFRSAEKVCEPLPGFDSNRLEFRTRGYTATTNAVGYEDLIYELRDTDGDGAATDLQRSADDGATWRTIISGVQNETFVDDDYNTIAETYLRGDYDAAKERALLMSRAPKLLAALRALVATCESVVPDHIATDPDHDYAKADDAARAAIAEAMGVRS